MGLDARLGLPFGQLRAAGREAARLGFESLWTPAGGVRIVTARPGLEPVGQAMAALTPALIRAAERTGPEPR